MMEDNEQVLDMMTPGHCEAASVPLPISPDGSLMQSTPMDSESAIFGSSEETPLTASIVIESQTVPETAPPTVATNPMLHSSERKQASSAKPMSPEKAALAAMFDSIKMPAPASPSKSPRKASGSSISSSPSKQLAREAAPKAVSLFRKSSSPSTSPSKVGSTDSAASRPYSGDSPFRRPVVISSYSSPGKRLEGPGSDTKNASTPLSPAPASSSAGSRPARMRPSMLASSSSPSARLSDLTLNLDTTGTQELIFNQDASFLAAAANTAADVTIDDSFDVSRAKARIRTSSAASSAAATRRSSPAKLGGYKARPRCSVVPEDDVAEIKPRSPGKRSTAFGLRGLGVGRVVKNAAGDDTIELNLTGSFIGNSSIIGGNLMDESAEASLLLSNNSFSISRSHPSNKEAEQPAKQLLSKKARGSDDDDDDEDEEEDYERDARNVQKWAAEAARKAQLGRQIVDKTPSRASVVSRTGSSTVTRPSAASVKVTKPVSRIAPRPSLVTPTTTSRLLKPRASGIATVKPETMLPRSGSASSGLSSTTTLSATLSSIDTPSEAKTPMRSRRKSTFTTTRPPVSGPARRRESLAASAIVQAHPIPPLPALGSITPGRTRTASTPASAGSSPSMKTPTAATRTLPKPRVSLTGRTSIALPTPRASAPVASAGTGSVGNVARPRASLASTATARTATVRSASLATPSSRVATARSSVEATGGMRRSTSQPQGLDGDETPVARPRTLVPRASLSSASRPSTMATPRARTAAFAERPGNSAPVAGKMETVSKIGVAAVRRPSITPAEGGFGFKPRTSAVYIGRASLLDADDKEN